VAPLRPPLRARQPLRPHPVRRPLPPSSAPILGLTISLHRGLPALRLAPSFCACNPMERPQATSMKIRTTPSLLSSLRERPACRTDRSHCPALTTATAKFLAPTCLQPSRLWARRIARVRPARSSTLTVLMARATAHSRRPKHRPRLPPFLRRHQSHLYLSCVKQARANTVCFPIGEAPTDAPSQKARRTRSAGCLVSSLSDEFRCLPIFVRS